MVFDFDAPVDRAGTWSTRWDRYPGDVIPLWVADTDFRAPACVIDAMRRRLEHGVFGYTVQPRELREAIVEQWPAAERVYALVGMVEDPAVGLDLRRVSSRESTRNGVRVLLIEGEVANVSGKVRDIPRLRGGLYDERDRALKTWSFSAPDPKLLPGETTRFVTELENPPQGAVRLTIVFDGDK